MVTYLGTNPLVIAKVVRLGAQIERRRAFGKPTKALESQVDRVIRDAHAREKRRTPS